MWIITGRIAKEGRKPLVLEAILWEAFENRLRVALIRSGDSVIIKISGFEQLFQNKQGGTAGKASLASEKYSSLQYLGMRYI